MCIIIHEYIGNLKGVYSLYFIKSFIAFFKLIIIFLREKMQCNIIFTQQYNSEVLNGKGISNYTLLHIIYLLQRRNSSVIHR